MHLDSFTALLAASNLFLGAAAGPVFAKRQDEPSSTLPSATSESSAEITSSTRVLPSLGLIVETLSNGDETTREFVAPNPTPDASSTGEASAEKTEDPKTTYTFSRTGLPVPASTNFPVCKDANAKPFCQPSDESKLHVGKTYYATWNSEFFPANSTVVVKVLYSNDTAQEVWSSEKTPNGWGFVAFDTKKGWKQGYDRFNLSLQALNFVDSDENAKAEVFDGPMFTLIDEPPRHYPPPPPTKFHKEGLIIGLPLALCFVVLVVVGLGWGMKKHRTIGLGNVMGRKNRGYGQRKSRRERLGLGKKGAIRLEDRESAPHSRDRSNSLGSLTGDDDARPLPRGNAFRDEIRRQKTGRND